LRRANEFCALDLPPNPEEAAVFDPARRKLPTTVAVTAGVLLAIPVLALLIVPIYARSAPELWGFPFFYWYQFAWVFLASAFTATAHSVILRARRTTSGEEPVR
jgi:hypothetical protein